MKKSRQALLLSASMIFGSAGCAKAPDTDIRNPSTRTEADLPALPAIPPPLAVPEGEKPRTELREVFGLLGECVRPPAPGEETGRPMQLIVEGDLTIILGDHGQKMTAAGDVERDVSFSACEIQPAMHLKAVDTQNPSATAVIDSRAVPEALVDFECRVGSESISSKDMPDLNGNTPGRGVKSFAIGVAAPKEGRFDHIFLVRMEDDRKGRGRLESNWISATEMKPEAERDNAVCTLRPVIPPKLEKAREYY